MRVQMQVKPFTNLTMKLCYVLRDNNNHDLFVTSPFEKISRVSEKLQGQSVDMDSVMDYTVTCNYFYPPSG